MHMHNPVRGKVVEEVFAVGLHPEQRRLALRPCDGRCVEPALGRRDPQRLAAEVLGVVTRRAVNGVSFGHSVGG